MRLTRRTDRPGFPRHAGIEFLLCEMAFLQLLADGGIKTGDAETGRRLVLRFVLTEAR